MSADSDEATRPYRAVVGDELGPIANYSLRTMPPRSAAPGQVCIAVRAAGVSFVDTLVAEGRYQAKPSLPFTPGSECSGVIIAVGRDVPEFAVGQKVVATGWAGMYAERAWLPVTSVWPMPDGLSFAEAATFPVSYATAWHALVDRANIASGETLLVLGAGGATGYAAVQIGRYLGCHVVASASSQAKRSMAMRGGAQAAVDSGSANWRDEVKVAAHGKPLDVIFDPVGGDATEAAFRCLGYGGRHLVVGFPGGVARLATNLPLLKQASLIGVNLSALQAARPDHARANQRRVFDLANQGALKPVVAGTFALPDFSAAMAQAAGGTDAGRVVIEVE